MTEQLMEALVDSAGWLERFTRRDYDGAFADYCRRFLLPWREAVTAAGEAGAEALAESLLDAMEARWKRERLWNRSQVRGEMKQVLVVYLSPMLLEEPALRRFAGVLRDGWNRRRPGDAYHVAGYQRIRSGFKLRIMGFELPERKKPEPLDEEL